MNSVSKDCQELKNVYDACFNLWYSEKFLKGEVDDKICEPLYNKYQDCVKKAIKKLKINYPELQDTSQENIGDK